MKVGINTLRCFIGTLLWGLFCPWRVPINTRLGLILVQFICRPITLRLPEIRSAAVRAAA